MDDFTRYTWLFFLSDKSDAFATFKTFVKRIHNEFETTIKKVRSDNEVNSRTQELMRFVMNLLLGINSKLSTLHNQIVLLRERIKP